MKFEEVMDKAEELSTKEEIEEFLADNPKVQPPEEELPDFKELRRQIRIVIKGFDRYSVLKWLTATSMIQGNEKYFTRFLFSKFIVTTIDEDYFGDEEFGRKEVIQILHKFGESWSLLEDYTVFPNDTKNRIGFDREEYYFIACENENPGTLLESIVRRYSKIDEEKDIFDFDVKEELKKMLEYQTNLVRFIESCNQYNEIKGFQIPEKAFVEGFEDIWLDVSEFESSLGNSLDGEKLSHYDEIRARVNEKPNFEGMPLFINVQLEVLINDITECLENNLEDCSDLLAKQLEELVFESLGEIVPIEAVEHDYEIGDEQFDFSFAVDNRIVLGKIVPEKDYEDDYTDKVRSILDGFEEVNEKIENEGVDQFGGEDVEKSLSPIFIVLLDDIFEKMTFANKREFTFSILSYQQLSYLSKRMYEEETPIHFILKTIEDGQITGKPQTGDMNVFEQAFVFETDESLPIMEYIEHPRKRHYLWKDEERKLHRESMPRLDKRPEFVEESLIFKLIESEDGEVVRGYSGTTPHEFYCYNEIYCIWNEGINTGYEDKLASTMAKMCTISLKTAVNSLDLDLGYQEVFAYTINQAEEIGVLDQGEMEPVPIAISTAREEIVIVFDPFEFGKSARDSHLEIFSYILNVILLEEVDDYIPLEMNRHMDFDPIKEFSILSVPYTGETVSAGHVSPTLFDIMDVESSIYEEFSEDFDNENYDAKETREALIKVHHFLQDQLKQYLEKFSQESVVRSVFQQLEVINNERKMNQVDLGGYKGEKHIDRLIEEYKDKDDDLGRYSAASQLLLEKAVLHDIGGEEDYGIFEHQRALTYALRISEIAGSIAQVRSESEVLDISVSIDFKNKFGITFDKQDRPRDRFMEKQALSLYESNPEDVFKEDPEDVESKSEASISDLEKKTEDSNLESINEAFYEDLGFYLYDYIYLVGKISWKDEWKDEVGKVEVEKEELVDYLNKDSDINRERIENMLDLLTLHFDDEQEVVKAWKVESRNRIFARPFIQIEDRLFSGLDMLFMSQDRITEAILKGRWIIPGEAPPKISEELEKIREENNNNFEKEVHKKVESLSDEALHSIGEPNKQGQIFEKGNNSPGEIDTLSIHKDQEKIILWEAKDIEGRIGPREIAYKIKEFINDEEHIKKLNRKEEFIRNNLNHIIDSHNLEEEKVWNIESVFVFSEYSYFAELINEKHDTISYREIESHISKL